MHLTTITSLLLSLSLASATPVAITEQATASEETSPNLLAKRPCYEGGKTWGDNASDAIVKVSVWCNGGGGNGNYGPHAERRGCFNARYGNNRYNFKILNDGNQSHNLSPAVCEELLWEHIYNCRHGGWGKPVAQWESTSDVNEGRC
jgi:Y3-like glycan binding protein